ncbi:MAG: hypothetical protein HOQ32_16660 [Lysobacter sp.]|nr:hypothetical protein [Lysobacter sp.]
MAAMAALPAVAMASDVGPGAATLLLGIPIMAAALLTLAVLALFRRLHVVAFGFGMLVFGVAAFVLWTLRTDVASLHGSTLAAAAWVYYGLFAGAAACFATMVVRGYKAQG